MTEPMQLLEHFRQEHAVASVTRYLRRQRWFGGRSREVVEVLPIEAVPLRDRSDLGLWTVLVRVTYTEGDEDVYNLLLSRRPIADAVASEDGDVRLVYVTEQEGVPSAICDALYDPEALAELWAAIRAAETHPGAGGDVACINLRMGTEDEAEAEQVGGADIRLLGREQSNTSVVRADRELLKCLRRVSPGISPELELTDALARAGFDRVAAPLGAVEYRPAAGDDPTLLSIVQPFFHNGTDGWTLALTSLRALYADVEDMSLPGSVESGPRARPLPGGGNAVAVRAEPRPATDGLGAETAAFAPEAARLGRTTAEMHLAALSAGPGPALEAQPVTRAHLDAWADEMLAELDALLAGDDPSLAPLRAHRPRLVGAFDAIRELSGGTAIRVHGDYHLGQTLRTDDGWTVIDFEGEPNLPLSERRRQSSALRDVAGMLRSFDYAAAAALAERLQPTDPDWTSLEPLGDAWAAASGSAFWDAYLETVEGSPLLPDGDGARVLLLAFELRKAVYETGYELGHRPDWVGIPLRFLLSGGPP
jgi:trehalose synthase-fused probable maltokinase